MSKILEELIQDKISLTICLQRLLVIANKIKNNDVANWCVLELNGYKDNKHIPDYRNFESDLFMYTGFNGRAQVKIHRCHYGQLIRKNLKV